MKKESPLVFKMLVQREGKFYHSLRMCWGYDCR